MSGKIYRDYFNIDPKYYAAVTADLIYSGKVSWKSDVKLPGKGPAAWAGL